MSYLAAASLLEAGQWDRARVHGAEARDLFRTGRHGFLEALAVSVLRLVDLRGDPPGEPDPALVDAAADVSRAAEGQLAWIEAAMAYRRGDAALCLSLAERAIPALQASATGPSLALALALRAAVAPHRADLEAIEALAAAQTAQIEIQVLGLLARGAGPRPAWATRVGALLPALADRDPELRMEVATIPEVLRWVGLAAAAAREGPCPGT
jgi:hypothetical protein